MKAIVLAAAGVLGATAALAETPVLTVYSPDYFASEWGPGPAIEAAFEEICACDLQWRPGDLLPRLLLEGERTEADVMIGFTMDIQKKARDSGLLAPHGQDLSALTLPIEWDDPVFLPFDYSHAAFVYDAERITNPPHSFEDLAAMDDVRLVIEDPRSSLSGLALVLWVKAVHGDKAEDYWRRLAPRILTVTKGWSEAYGLFTDGEADMVLSFTTSPAYHIAAEGDTGKKAAIFDEGHYLLVETAAKVKTTDQPDLADRFMAFILSPAFQKLIPTTNWSFPAALPREAWPEAFRTLPTPQKVILYSEEEAAALRDEAIEEWRRALSR